MYRFMGELREYSYKVITTQSQQIAAAVRQSTAVQLHKTDTYRKSSAVRTGPQEIPCVKC